MKWARGVLLASAAWLAVSGTTHAQSNVQFSGEAVQSGPDGKTRHAQIYIGDNQVRLEHARGGQEMVEIYDMKNQRVLLLVPQQKVYMQRDFAPGTAGNPLLPPKDSNPCVSLTDAQCKKVSTDTLFGRAVTQWEMSVEHDGKTLRSLHWIDDQRHMSLRDVWPDGTTTESILQGKESLHGRPTERWQRTTTLADGKQRTSTQWYDPELQIAIREELPDGHTREIRDIQVTSQPASLFEVPAGYQRVEQETRAIPPNGSANPMNGR